MRLKPNLLSLLILIAGIGALIAVWIALTEDIVGTGFGRSSAVVVVHKEDDPRIFWENVAIWCVCGIGLIYSAWRTARDEHDADHDSFRNRVKRRAQAIRSRIKDRS